MSLDEQITRDLESTMLAKFPHAKQTKEFTEVFCNVNEWNYQNIQEIMVYPETPEDLKQKTIVKFNERMAKVRGVTKFYIRYETFKSKNKSFAAIHLGLFPK
jgi:hypothetical protein